MIYRIRPVRAALLRAAIAAPVIVGIGFAWFCHINVPPTADVPTPTLPSPNALDTLLLADSQVVQRDDAEGATATVPVEGQRFYTPAEKARLVAENAQALATLRVALTQTYANRPLRRIDQPIPELAKFRGLARLLAIEGQVREANGDYAGAAESSLDTIRLGVAAPRGGGIIHALVGIACEAIGEKPLWARIDHLNAEQAASLARRLEALNDQTVPFVDSLHEEKWIGESSMVNLLRRETTFRLWDDLASPVDEVSSEDSPMSVSNRLRAYAGLTRYTKQQIVDGYAAAMDSDIAAAARPHNANAPALAEPGDPINSFFFGRFDQARFKRDSLRMSTAMLSTVAALRAYRLTHGAYPETLNDLVRDNLLSHLPADPFAPTDNVPLPYRRLESDRFLLYSVGPDGADDGGRSVDRSRWKPGFHTWPDQTDKGDWVFGINTP